MQDLPDKSDLLAGVQRFLAEHVGPALEDRGAQFRLKIAIYLLDIVQREMTHAEAQDRAEWSSLCHLLAIDRAMPTDENERRRVFQAANRALAAQIQAGHFEDDTAVRAHIMASMRAKLAVVQPKFDLRLACETAQATVKE